MLYFESREYYMGGSSCIMWPPKSHQTSEQMAFCQEHTLMRTIYQSHGIENANMCNL